MAVAQSPSRGRGSDQCTYYDMIIIINYTHDICEHVMVLYEIKFFTNVLKILKNYK